MIWPNSRRAFAAREWQNRNADLASLWRALAQWQNYTYDADLAITPGDAKYYITTSVWPWLAYLQPGPLLTASGASLSRIYVSPPRSPSMGLVRVWGYVRCALTEVGTFRVTNPRTGTVTSTAVDTAALGRGGATEGWVHVDVPAQAHDA